MKTKYWILALGLLLAVCLGLSAAYLLAPEGTWAEVWSDGKLLYRLDLSVDQVLTVESAGGTNVIEVKAGKVTVIEADCPDGWCMKMGRRNAGQIVCLPNRLVIRFTAGTQIDGIAG